MKAAWKRQQDELRLLIAVKLIRAVVWVVPKGHPATTIILKGLLYICSHPLTSGRSTNGHE